MHRSAGYGRDVGSPLAQTDTAGATTALVVVDLQHATVAIQSAQGMSYVLGNVVRLADAFRSCGLPVVLTRSDLNHPPTGRTAYSDVVRPPVPEAALALVPEVGPAAGDLLVDKRGWGAFVNTDLNALLQGRQVTQVVLAGLATSYGVESTARQAYDLGYHVIVVRDAVNDPTSDGHEHSLLRVIPALGRVVTTDEVVEVLPRSD